MRTIILFMAMATATATSWAEQVETQAGALSSHITNHNITSLKITGTIDARDFKFMADKLSQLSTLDMGEVTIAAYENVKQPVFESVQTYEANSIPATCFFGKSLQSVTLPANLKSIGLAAFAGCRQLKNITIPATVESIASYAFSSSGLTAVDLPDNVKTLGVGVYARCANLTRANIASASIATATFLADDKLNDVTLGAEVKEVGASAFGGCTALKEIKFATGSNIKAIGNEAFIKSSISKLDLSALGKLTSIGNWAIATSNVQQVVLPSQVKSIGQGAFFYNSSLASAHVPPAVGEISDYTFAGSQALAVDKILENGITNIGDYAFYNVSQAQHFLIPSTVSHLGNYAMAGMIGLQSITAQPTTVPTLGNNVWAGINQPAVLLDIAEKTVAQHYAETEGWKEFHIVLPTMLGDVNEDNKIDVTDVSILINKLLGNNPTPFNFHNADINGDNELNVNDVTGLIDLILTRTDNAKRKNAQQAMTNDHISIDNFNIKPGETHTIEVQMNNAQTYIATQFDIALPQGLSIVDGSIKSSNRTAQHSFLTRVQNAGKTTRFMAYSNNNVEINGNEGAIISLTIKADTHLPAISTINISEVVFVTPDLKACDGISSSTTVSNTTGVDNIANNKVKVYAHNGILVIESEVATAAQMVAMNGMTSELYVEAGHNEYQDFAEGFYIVHLNGKSFKIAIR